jgi:hypothetical protein
MIHVLKNLPDPVAGFSAVGTITKYDYERVIIPVVEEKLKAHEKVSMLYHIGPKYQHFSLGAAWDDLKLGVKHLRSWKRIALVSDVRWIRGGIRVLGWLMPAKVHVFHNEQFNQARAWVCVN